MTLSSIQIRWRMLALLHGLVAGCASAGPFSADRIPMPPRPALLAAPADAPRPGSNGLQLVAAQTLPTNSPQEQSAGQLPPEATKELSVDALVEQVLARNPSLAQMAAAWQAASARYPQSIALDDPMFGTSLAPGSVGNANVNFGWRVEVSQKLPWPGKRDLRGQAAAAEANAASHEFEDTRVQLVEAARLAFYEYYLVGRALAVNDEALRLLTEFHDNAQTRYKTGAAPQQDMLQADVEIGRQRERQLSLERMRDVAVARINTLMNQPTNQSLPPPPADLEAPAGLPEREWLQAAAMANRPDLQALAARIAADQNALALAQKEYRPDVEVMAAYDGFWQGPQQALAPQIGLRMNVPLRYSRRNAAVAEAEAKLAGRVAEFEQRRNQVNLQVEEALAQAREAERIVKLYTDTILPAAELNVKAAQSAYTTGKTPFISLIEAQRSRVNLRDRYYEAIADVFRKRASLERAVGGPILQQK